MKTPQEIYTAYKIMPALQLHQLRVAAVGKLICDNFQQPINERDVVLACLFHDMGNIVKFKLGQIPEFLEPEGLDYWENVQSEYKQKYGGADQHAANEKIARELGLSEEAISYIAAVSFSKVGEVVKSSSFEKKICKYSDSRVGPHGVLSLDERLRDGRKRYLKRIDAVQQDGVAAPADTFEALMKLEHELEDQIFAVTDIKPGDINDATVAPLIGELSEYPVA